LNESIWIIVTIIIIIIISIIIIITTIITIITCDTLRLVFSLVSFVGQRASDGVQSP
jgi:hypothetical protein